MHGPGIMVTYCVHKGTTWDTTGKIPNPRQRRLGDVVVLDDRKSYVIKKIEARPRPYDLTFTIV